MSKSLISVIIPVYNVERYVEECLKSVLNQTYRNLEIIIIDDGSTDASAEICKRYALKDKRIIFLQQENQGVASARKNAFLHSTGEYVGFVDADDWIDSDLFEKMLQEIKDYDLITTGIFCEYSERVVEMDRLETGVYDTVEKMNYLIDNMICYKGKNIRGIIRSCYAKLFKQDILKRIFENVNTNIFMGEDGEVLYRYILQCNKVMVSDICGYHYRIRGKSAVRSINKKYLLNIHELYSTLEPIFSEHTCAEGLLHQLEIWITVMIKDATLFLGFLDENFCIRFYFPLMKMIAGKKVVVWGAGRVGKSYVSLFRKTNICDIKLWVDKKPELYAGQLTKVEPVERIFDVEYDYIVIAVKKEKAAKDIEDELISMGIEEDKILWGEPEE